MTENALDYSRIDPTEAAATGMALAVHAAVKPAAPAVVDRFGEHTWRDLNDKANRLANYIREANLKPDDGIALLASNRVEFIEVMMAAFRTGHSGHTYKLAPYRRGNWLHCQ